MGLKGFIVALIILEAGLFLLRQIGKGFLSSFPVAGGIAQTVTSFSAMLDLFLLGVGVLIIILIIAAALRRGKGKPREAKEAYEAREEAKEEKPEEEPEAEEAEEEKGDEE